MRHLAVIILALLVGNSCICIPVDMDDDEDDDDEDEDDNEYENQTPDENSNPGGCGDEPVPTYANEMCDHWEHESEGYHSIIFVWCCLDGEYVREN